MMVYATRSVVTECTSTKSFAMMAIKGEVLVALLSAFQRKTTIAERATLAVGTHVDGLPQK